VTPARPPHELRRRRGAPPVDEGEQVAHGFLWALWPALVFWAVAIGLVLYACTGR
jgi:hypothetical protein